MDAEGMPILPLETILVLVVSLRGVMGSIVSVEVDVALEEEDEEVDDEVDGVVVVEVEVEVFEEVDLLELEEVVVVEDVVMLFPPMA